MTQEEYKEIQKKYPSYTVYGGAKDEFKILACQIRIWELKDKSKPLETPPEDCLTLYEVESVEITESFKNVFGSATVKFPRGTVVKNTDMVITTENETRVIDDNQSIIANVDNNDYGVVTELRDNARLANVSDFKAGKRIQIKLGYLTDPSDVKDKSKYTKCLTTMFEGYITKCSIATPIEIKCENLASGLKKISCENKTIKNATVNQLFKAGGKYDLLKNTGLRLHPDTIANEIHVGNLPLTNNLTIADIFTSWSKWKIYSFLKIDESNQNEEPCIAVGRAYFTKTAKDGILGSASKTIPTIQFDYHVAEDNLTLMSKDKNFLAVEAQMMDMNDHFYKITIRLNPEYDEKAKSGDKAKKWQIMNETKLSKKAMKAYAVSKTGTTSKVDLSTYTIIPYLSKKIVPNFNSSNQDELIKEAQTYFENYCMTGIEGTLTLFGDLGLRTGTKVELLDIHQPAKNGYYVVEEVTTKFGTSGYRQIIKLPYRLKKEDNTYGRENTK